MPETKPNHVWLIRLAAIDMTGVKSNTARQFPVVTPLTSAKDVSHWLRHTKFTQTWWEEHTIIDILDLGEVWHA